MNRLLMPDNFMYEETKKKMKKHPSVWLVTGVAGFIGSNLLEALLNLDQKVTGVDNFITGHRYNLDEVRRAVGEKKWKNFKFIEGDIADLGTCNEACSGMDYVLHQAGLGSVPRSIENPLLFHRNNDIGFVNILTAARDAKVKRFVFAASSSTYGDEPMLPKVEDRIGRPLSPYAATKYINEIYADVFARCYGVQYAGLRYFNVFGKRQDPNGAYAAVIPKWIASMIRGEPIVINGDGETSRDFCYVENNIQANLLAATTENPDAINQVYNVAVGERTTLNELLKILQEELCAVSGVVPTVAPIYREFRPGDIRHSLADISKARRLLGYDPLCSTRDCLRFAMRWYFDTLRQ